MNIINKYANGGAVPCKACAAAAALTPGYRRRLRRLSMLKTDGIYKQSKSKSNGNKTK